MIRNDFVSNSSSSSFIVSSIDNKYDILLRDYNILTLEEYVKHYIKEDILNYGVLCKKEDFIYLSDMPYNKIFSKSLANAFPENTKDDVEAYLTLLNNRPNANWDSDVISDWSKNLDSIFNRIKNKIFETLQLKWKDVKFHVSKVNDDILYTSDGEEIEREDMCTTETELVQQRIEYMNELKPIKFYRCFDHH